MLFNLMGGFAKIECVLDNEYPWHEQAAIGTGVSIGIVKDTPESNFTFEYLIFNNVRYNTLLSNNDVFDGWCYLWHLDEDVKRVNGYSEQLGGVFPVVSGGVFLRGLTVLGVIANEISLTVDAYDVKQGVSGLEVCAKSFTIGLGVAVA
jgi:hypothetical protein